MKLIYSFKSKIAVILLIIVLIVSSASFYLYSRLLSNHLMKENQSALPEIVKSFHSQCNLSIRQKDGSSIFPMLELFEQKPHILKTYILNPKGEIIFPGYLKGKKNLIYLPEEAVFENQEIFIQNLEKKDKNITRTYTVFRNSKECYECHQDAGKNIAYLVCDFSNKEITKNLNFIRLSSITFSLFMVFIISGTIWLIHRIYIQASLKKFLSAFEEINKGNLKIRLPDLSTEELNTLAKEFNQMMDNFQSTQIELTNYHKKEIKETKKLASIGEMAARLAHEIRNPITGIANAIDIFGRQINDEENIPILDEIKFQANRVNEVITSLLKYSAPKNLKLEKTAIHEIVVLVVGLLKFHVQGKSINIEIVGMNEVPMVSIDRNLIENVLINLGINAIQSIEKQGNINFRILSDSSTNEVIISVEDDGEGIDEIHAGMIFKPFFTTKTVGTGLGLAIAQDTVESHGGRIWYVKNNPKGCVFSLAFPIVEN